MTTRPPDKPDKPARVSYYFYTRLIPYKSLHSGFASHAHGERVFSILTFRNPLSYAANLISPIVRTVYTGLRVKSRSNSRSPRGTNMKIIGALQYFSGVDRADRCPTLTEDRSLLRRVYCRLLPKEKKKGTNTTDRRAISARKQAVLIRSVGPSRCIKMYSRHPARYSTSISLANRPRCTGDK